MTFTPNRGDARIETPPGPTVYEQYKISSFTPDGGARLAFPVTSIRHSTGNRLVEHERPYRRGAKVDSTGEKADRWTVTAVFNNTIEQEGIDPNTPLYPTILTELQDAGRVQKTGDVYLPTVGAKRVKLDSAERIETADKRDYGELSLVFVEDNEDGVDAGSITSPTVSANAIRLAETTEFSAQEDTAWDYSILDLKELAAGLEGLANAPNEAIGDLYSQANVVMAACDRALKIFSRPETPGRGQFVNDPETVTTQRKVHQIKEYAGQVRNDARRAQPPLRSLVFEKPQSLMSISAMLLVDLIELMNANPNLPNPYYIPAGTIVRVPADGPITRQG